MSLTDVEVCCSSLNACCSQCAAVMFMYSRYNEDVPVCAKNLCVLVMYSKCQNVPKRQAF